MKNLAVIGLCLLILAASIGSPAAQVPFFKTEDWCTRVATTSDGLKSEVMYGACLSQEQTAYDDLKARWGALPNKVRDWCHQVARTRDGQGSYTMLRSCIEQEIKAGADNAGRQLRR